MLGSDPKTSNGALPTPSQGTAQLPEGKSSTAGAVRIQMPSGRSCTSAITLATQFTAPAMHSQRRARGTSAAALATQVTAPSMHSQR